jgi:hypothetical protein
VQEGWNEHVEGSATVATSRGISTNCTAPIRSTASVALVHALSGVTIPEMMDNKLTPWPESASQLYRLRDGCLSEKLLPLFVDRGCHVESVTDPYGRIPGFLDRSRYFFFQVAPQLYSRG